MNRVLQFSILICLLLLPQAHAGEASNAIPCQEAPLSWQKELAYYTDRGLVPGIMVMVSSPEWGNVVSQSGVAAFGGSSPIQPDMQFRLGPLTRLLTSVIILQLETEHKLRLDMTVDEFLGGGLVPNSDKITLRDCLNMRGGIFDYRKEPMLNGETPQLGARPIVPEAILSDLWQQLRAGAGEVDAQFSPSDTGYLLAGRLIERLEKKSLPEVFQERIVKPLNIVGGYLEDGREIPANMVHGYTGMKGTMRDRTGADSLLLGAAGGFVATPFDAMHAMQAVMKTDKLISRLAYAKLSKFMNASSQREEDSYALGMVERVSNRGTFRGVEGSVPGYYTSAVYYPWGDAMLLILINTSDNEFVGNELTNEIMRRITGATLVHTPADKAEVGLTDGGLRLEWQAGFYYGETYEIYLGESENAVRKANPGSKDARLLTVDRNTFSIEVRELAPGKTYYWRVDAIRHLTDDEQDNERRRRKNLRGTYEKMPVRLVEEVERIEGPVKSFVVR
jgi:D-alanyl-D-alanine carboxypeptidase